MEPRDKGGGTGRRLRRWGGLLCVVLLIYLVGFPVPIDPVAVSPPPSPPLEGATAPNHRLRDAVVLADGQVYGPEDVAIDRHGVLFVGTEDGKIVQLDPDKNTVSNFATGLGRPLGLAFDVNGSLIVADGEKGLLSIDDNQKVTVLTVAAEGIPFGFTDDVDVAADGRIYFSDASDKFGPKDYVFDLLEGRPNGRLLRYDPKSEQTELLLEDLYFANGVAVSKDQQFVLVNETARFRVMRYWLRGPKTGQQDVFCDHLPGYPDGISTSPRGTFWLAIFTRRNEQADALAPSPFFKKLMARLPRFLWPRAEPYGLVLELDPKGKVLRSLHDPGGERLRNITSVEEHDGILYLGSLNSPRFARYRL